MKTISLLSNVIKGDRIVVKGAPRLEVARRHPPIPRLKADNAPSRGRRVGAQGATRSLDLPPARYALLLLLLLLLLFFSRCRVAEG